MEEGRPWPSTSWRDAQGVRSGGRRAGRPGSEARELVFVNPPGRLRTGGPGPRGSSDVAETEGVGRRPLRPPRPRPLVPCGWPGSLGFGVGILVPQLHPTWSGSAPWALGSLGLAPPYAAASGQSWDLPIIPSGLACGHCQRPLDPRPSHRWHAAPFLPLSASCWGRTPSPSGRVAWHAPWLSSWAYVDVSPNVGHLPEGRACVPWRTWVRVQSPVCCRPPRLAFSFSAFTWRVNSSNRYSLGARVSGGNLAMSWQALPPGWVSQAHSSSDLPLPCSSTCSGWREGW